MPRARNVKPAFFLNEVLAGLAAWVRLLFVGLWTLADRAGRLLDRPKRIQAVLFPYESDLDIVAGLDQLAGNGFITRYAVDGQRYIQIANWAKHQHPHHQEPASEIPALESKSTSDNLRCASDDEPMSSLSRPEPIRLQSSIFNLQSSTLNLQSERAGRRLHEFLTAFPKRTKTDAAARAYVSTIRSDQEHEELMAGLSRWLQSDQWRRSLDNDGGRYVPDPDKFLFDRRYLEHPEPYREGGGGADPGGAAAAEVLERQRKEVA